MASPSIASVSKDVKALHDKFDALVTPSFWTQHIGWTIACAACAALGWLAHGLI